MILRTMLLGASIAQSLVNSVLVEPPTKGPRKNNRRPDGSLVDPGPGPISFAPARNKPGLYCHEQPIPRPYRGRDDKTWG